MCAVPPVHRSSWAARVVQTALPTLEPTLLAHHIGTHASATSAAAPARVAEAGIWSSAFTHDPARQHREITRSSGVSPRRDRAVALGKRVRLQFDAAGGGRRW